MHWGGDGGEVTTHVGWRKQGENYLNWQKREDGLSPINEELGSTERENHQKEVSYYK
jgi:hypothetical protein